MVAMIKNKKQQQYIWLTITLYEIYSQKNIPQLHNLCCNFESYSKSWLGGNLTQILLKNIDNSIDDYNCHIQKIMILQVIQQIFCEMLVRGTNMVNSDGIFLITNIRTNVQ